MISLENMLEDIRSSHQEVIDNDRKQLQFDNEGISERQERD